MTNHPLNTLRRITLLITFNLSLVACGGGGETPVNSTPVASDASVSLTPGSSVTDTLTVNDVDGDNLAISIVTDASNGTLTLDNATTGTYTYTHGGNADGDSFTFWAFDGLLDSNIATVTVTTVVPEPPASGLLATPGDQRVTLNWDAVDGAESYNVNFVDANGDKSGSVVDVTSPYYHDGLINGQNYYYEVTAVNAVGESAASSAVNATPVDIRIDSLTFLDTNLDACIQAQAAGAGATFVHDLTILDCDSKSITQLAGIEALTSLTLLFLGSNSISDVSSLASLTSLFFLILGSNSISDVSPLGSLTSLTTLYLHSNSISDVSPLGSLANLTDLYLGNNIDMSCSSLSGLITTLESPPVDTDFDLYATDTAMNGTNCTNP